MGNRGLINGLNKSRWKDYQPVLDSWTGYTSPTLGQLGTNFGPGSYGRYLYVREQNLVLYDFYLTFGQVGNSGGAGYYLVKLPIPAKAQMGGYMGGGFGGANAVDRFIGSGHVSQGLSETPNIPIEFMVADTYANTYGGKRNDWAQAFCPYQRMEGSCTIATSASTVAVTWPGGITLGSTPDPADIVIAPVNAKAAGSATYITTGNVSTTGFTLTTPTAPSGSSATYHWKLISDQSLLIGSTAPWNMGGSFDSIKGHLRYEAEA